MKPLTNHLATPIAFHTADNHRVANFYDLDRLGLDDQFKDVVQNQLKSVAALMEDNELTKRGESFHLNRTVTLKDHTARSGHRYGSQGCRLADNQPFENEPTNAFGTGFLVGSRYLMTAGHCIGEQNGSCRVDFNKIYKIKVVFGYLMKDANDHEREFPASHVYTIKKVVGFFQTQLGHSNYSDWALVKLDRQVEGRTPLELDPIPVSDQDTYTIGHPLGTPAKLSLGERVKDIVGKNCFSVSHDVFPGNSGGPTFDRSTKKVIGITVLSYKNVFEKINVNGEDRAIFHILTSEESALRYDEAQKIVPLIERINICKNKVGLKVIGTCQHLARVTTREGFGDFLLKKPGVSVNSDELLQKCWDCDGQISDISKLIFSRCTFEIWGIDRQGYYNEQTYNAYIQTYTLSDFSQYYAFGVTVKELPSHHGTDTSTTFRCRLQAIDVADRLANSCKIGQERALTQAIRKIRLLGSPLEINKNVDRGVIECAGFRAIHWAAYYGNDKAIEILSKAPGFDPNIENSGGYTPLHSAIGNLGNNIPRLVTTVNALLKAKADANRTNSSCCILWTKSCTPLHYAIWHLRNNGEQIIKSLIRNGADPEQQYGGQTAIEYADYYGLSSQIREAITAR